MNTSVIEPGTRLAGRYRLDERYSESQGSTLWKATDEILARSVAVRTFLPDFPRTSAVVAAASAASRLTDPRLAQVFDADDGGELSYVVSEWVTGHTLEDLVLSNGPMDPARATTLLHEVAQAIRAAHTAGLSHLRLTPRDLLWTTGSTVKILGLGVDAALVGIHDTTPDAALTDTRGIARLLYAAITAHWPGSDPRGRLPQAPESNGAICRPGQLVPGLPLALDTLTCRALGLLDDEPITTPAELARNLARLPRIPLPIFAGLASGPFPGFAPGASPTSTTPLPHVSSSSGPFGGQSSPEPTATGTTPWNIASPSGAHGDEGVYGSATSGGGSWNPSPHANPHLGPNAVPGNGLRPDSASGYDPARSGQQAIPPSSFGPRINGPSSAEPSPDDPTAGIPDDLQGFGAPRNPTPTSNGNYSFTPDPRNAGPSSFLDDNSSGSNGIEVASSLPNASKLEGGTGPGRPQISAHPGLPHVDAGHQTTASAGSAARHAIAGPGGTETASPGTGSARDSTDATFGPAIASLSGQGANFSSATAGPDSLGTPFAGDSASPSGAGLGGHGAGSGEATGLSSTPTAFTAGSVGPNGAGVGFGGNSSGLGAGFGSEAAGPGSAGTPFAGGGASPAGLGSGPGSGLGGNNGGFGGGTDGLGGLGGLGGPGAAFAGDSSGRGGDHGGTFSSEAARSGNTGPGSVGDSGVLGIAGFGGGAGAGDSSGLVSHGGGVGGVAADGGGPGGAGLGSDSGGLSVHGGEADGQGNAGTGVIGDSSGAGLGLGGHEGSFGSHQAAGFGGHGAGLGGVSALGFDTGGQGGTGGFGNGHATVGINAGSGPRHRGARAGGSSTSLRERRPLLIMAAGAVALVLGIGVWQLSQSGGGRTQNSVPSSALGGGKAPESPSQKPVVKITPVAAYGYDPSGPSHPDSAVGKDARSALGAHSDWHSQTYANASFGSYKSGLGLLVDLGTSTDITKVSVTVPGTRAPGTLELLVGDSRGSFGSFRQVARSGAASGAVEFTTAQAAKGRYVLLWFTKLPEASDGGFRAQLAGVSVYGRQG